MEFTQRFCSCSVCKKTVSGRQQTMECDQCQRWVHRLCGTGICQAESRDIAKRCVMAVNSPGCAQCAARRPPSGHFITPINGRKPTQRKTLTPSGSRCWKARCDDNVAMKVLFDVHGLLEHLCRADADNFHHICNDARQQMRLTGFMLPKTLRCIKDAVQHRNPRDVYNDMLQDDSVNAPRDLQQVQHAKHKIRHSRVPK